MKIDRVYGLPADFEHLGRPARAEGHQHLDRLAADMASGSNTFSLPGEALFTVRDGSLLLAIGGLNIDPYAGDLRTGRLRRVYTHPQARRRGIGQQLVRAIEQHALVQFSCLQLYTTAPDAAAFYRALAYVAVSGNPRVSHAKRLTTGTADSRRTEDP